MIPYIIGIGAPSCSGKTTLCQNLMNIYPNDVVILSQDRYYLGGDENTNYDIPESIDFNWLCKDIKSLKKGETIQAPIYDFNTHSRLEQFDVICPNKIVIVEGILVLHNLSLLNLLDLKVYVDAFRELRYDRRIDRDTKERGRTEISVKERYVRDVLPSNENYVEPTKSCADIIITNNKIMDIQVLIEKLKTKII